MTEGIEDRIVHAPSVALVASTAIDAARLRRWLAGLGVESWDRLRELPLADGDVLVEAAARCCYWSYNRGRGHAEHVAHLIEVGHESVLEHATFTLAIAGISRSCSHELVRHRHLSPSQLSQRYCGPDQVRFVCPPRIADGPDGTYRGWVAHCEASLRMYQAVLATLRESMSDAARKEVYEAARAVLPNCTETRLFVTGNGRSWRHFLRLRGSPAADAEIRQLACAIAPALKGAGPQVFADVECDGRVVFVGGGSS